ncbi:hypothetical protein K443DRAFT_336720 [Laccaria amethystina LaAM-08-1]|uniref:Uncharacterized protein n=1 Tax=Laccaria amethystina LaAM-08-1 TaxID=1095629 RepID=A0A0C9YC40_9AGAR|nr:hypothetical protein K443DRAFT_336720 [Laccaria amethystina LaAM-08-1]
MRFPGSKYFPGRRGATPRQLPQVPVFLNTYIGAPGSGPFSRSTSCSVSNTGLLDVLMDRLNCLFLLARFLTSFATKVASRFSRYEFAARRCRRSIDLVNKETCSN